MDEGLTDNQLTQLLPTAVDAAKAASVPIQAYFGGQMLDIQKKGDGSPVTQADREAEDLIRNHLLRNTEVGPLDILGEERGLQGPGTRWRWVVDPIDGTRSFVHGIPLFGTIIALLDTQKDVPLIGVIHLPILGMTYSAAKGLGARCQGESLQLSPDQELQNTIIGVGDLAQFQDAQREQDYQRLLTLSGYVRGYTDCFGHSLVVSGALGAMLDPALNPWDILATQVLIEEAGGSMVLRPSRIANKVDALFGSRAIVDTIARELGF
jgi:histidinol phosphatase-like enzyme (inositol monophosphatase family)